MEKMKEILNSSLLNKTIKDIEFFDTDLKYISPDMDHTWIVDGGIQIQLDNEYFSFFFTSEQEFFNVFPLKIEDLKLEFDIKRLGAKDVKEINELIEKKIVKTDFIWNFYKELNENGEEYSEKKYFPFEIMLYFNDNSFLQIAAVEYKIENNKLTDLIYNSENELLISINKRIEILNAS